ncbi:MAG: HlyD family type I secretion periplasmic adaptor subunit, partial [Pseudomonadota bacterium]
FDEGQATKARLLSLKRARLQLDGEAGELTAAIARTRKAVGETRLEIIQRELDFASAVARELEEAQTRMRDLRERAIAARDVLERLDIRAPADGVVVGRTVNTVGAVARPGETLMEIVPSDERLYVEVRIQPQDRDDVYAGQNADIRLIAFNQRTTPLVSGSVAYVSADALADPAGQGTFYTGRIALAEGTDPKLAEALTPGMPAEVLIKTEARTAFEYLARPILDSLNRAWRES